MKFAKYSSSTIELVECLICSPKGGKLLYPLTCWSNIMALLQRDPWYNVLCPALAEYKALTTLCVSVSRSILLEQVDQPLFLTLKELDNRVFFNQWVTFFPKAAYGKLAFRTMRRGCYLWNPDLDSVAAMETESGYLGLVVKFGTNILWKKYWLSNDFYPLWFSTFLFEKFAITSCVKLVPEIPVKPYTHVKQLLFACA